MTEKQEGAILSKKTETEWLFKRKNLWKLIKYGFVVFCLLIVGTCVFTFISVSREVKTEIANEKAELPVLKEKAELVFIKEPYSWESYKSKKSIEFKSKLIGWGYGDKEIYLYVDFNKEKPTKIILWITYDKYFNSYKYTWDRSASLVLHFDQDENQLLGLVDKYADAEYSFYGDYNSDSGTYYNSYKVSTTTNQIWTAWNISKKNLPYMYGRLSAITLTDAWGREVRLPKIPKKAQFYLRQILLELEAYENGRIKIGEEQE